MLLQTLDIKNNCSGVFHNGDMFKTSNQIEAVINDCKFAWKHSEVLNEEKYKYLYLYFKTDDLSGFLTPSEREEYKKLENKIKAQLKASLSAKIDLRSNCIFDLMPQYQIRDFFSLKERFFCRFLENENYEIPTDYDILHKAHVLATKIRSQDIIFKGEKTKILYNIFGSATGRLTTYRKSAPILTLKKEQRSLIKPSNDLFVEFDLNAAEIRTLLALSGKEQPEGDIHEWVACEVYNNEISREESKIRVFSWLYNSSTPETELAKFFSREIFRDFYNFQKRVLTTPFGRRIEVEERKAQNYLLQSTTSDIVIRNAYEIMKMLENKKSNIAFTLHDSVVIDMSKSDASLIKEIKNQFEETHWGSFSSTCKAGKDFGNLRSLEI